VKNLIQSMMIAGAVLVAAGAANAQTMAAKIPFEFSVSGKIMPAGEYRIEAQERPGSASIFRVENVNTRKSVFASAPVQSSVPYSTTPSTLAFTCIENSCELTGISSSVQGAKWKIAPTKPMREAMRAGVPVMSVYVQAD
jgi:hypothetical protein